MLASCSDVAVIIPCVSASVNGSNSVSDVPDITFHTCVAFIRISCALILDCLFAWTDSAMIPSYKITNSITTAIESYIRRAAIGFEPMTGRV